MSEKEVIEKIKEVILDECGKAGVEVVKIILFGSRARGEAKPDSDFDVYVVVENKIGFNEIADIVSKIKWQLALLNIPNDIIIRSKDDAERYRNSIGLISHYAQKEGINIWMR